MPVCLDVCAVIKVNINGVSLPSIILHGVRSNSTDD